MRLNNKEVSKWVKILGATNFINLFIEGKINLTPSQLEYVIKIKNAK